MKATIYNNLSNKKELKEIRAGHAIGDEFAGIGDDYAIYLVNGHEVEKDYILKEGDLVFVRFLPSAVTTSALVGLAVFLGAAAIIGGIAAGVAIYDQKRDANERMEAIKKISNRPDIDNRPFIRGASNTLAMGNSQPYIIGHNLFTPYLHASPIYKIEGEDGGEQYAERIFEAGFNKQNIKKIALGDITIKTFNTEDAEQGAFDLDGGQIFAEGRGEISQNGELLKAIPELNYKHDTRMQNAEVTRDEAVEAGTDVNYTAILNTNAKDIDIAITFPQGLYGYNDDGDKIETSVIITPSYSLDGGVSWIDFNFNVNGKATNTIQKNAQKELRYVAHHDFTLSDYKTLEAKKQNNILVRVRSNAKKDSKLINICYVLYIQSLLFDPNKSSAPAGTISDSGAAGLVNCLCVEDRERQYCTIIGLKIKATKNNEAVSDKMNIITNGLARVWDGSHWSKDKRPTRNPAAWVLEVLTSDTHPASKYEDNEIDLESLGDLFEHCEKNGYYYDQIITQNTRKGDTLANIVRCCDAVLYRDIYGRQAVAIDRPQPHALAVYNPQNIISISSKKDLVRRADGLRIKYVCSQNDVYIEDTYLLMREENGQPVPMTPDSIIRDIQLTGITTYSHVVKYARRLMAIEALRPKVTTIEIGSEGVVYTPFSKILIQDEQFKIGLSSGSIDKLNYSSTGVLTTIVLNGRVQFEAGKSYGLIVNAYNDTTAQPLYIKVRGVGYTDTVTVETKITDSDAVKPQNKDVYSFGELEGGEFVKVATPYLINEIKRNGTRYALELVEYNEAIYDAGVIPPYRPNLTEKPLPVPALPPSIDLPEGKKGEDGLTVFIDKPAIVLDADSSGGVLPQLIESNVYIQQKGVDVPFYIGALPTVDGFTLDRTYHTVEINVLEGREMAKNGVITIPINYHAILSAEDYVDENGDIYTDENGESYRNIVLSKEEKQLNLYISYAKSIKGEKGDNGKQGDRAGKYWGILDKAPEPPAEIIEGDYYLRSTDAVILKYIGGEWLPLSPDVEGEKEYYNLHINDIVSLLDKITPSTEIMSAVNGYFKKLLADTAFVDNLFAVTAFIQQLGANNIVLNKNGFIQSENFKDNTSGFKIESNGNAQFNKGIFNNITANGINATNGIFEGKVTATSGSFNGALTTDNFTMTINKGDIYIGSIYKHYYYLRDGKFKGSQQEMFCSCGRGAIDYNLLLRNDLNELSEFEVFLLKDNSSESSQETILRKKFSLKPYETLETEHQTIQLKEGDLFKIQISRWTGKTTQWQFRVDMRFYADVYCPSFISLGKSFAEDITDNTKQV